MTHSPPVHITGTRITLIRHGHVHNPDNVIYGRLPGFGLSRAGQQQAEAAARYLRNADIAAFYCSPQQRAEETANILLRYHPELAPITAPALDEVDNYFEGHPAEEVEARGWDLYTGVSDGYEKPADIGARAGDFIHKIRGEHSGEHIAAVTHGDVIAFAVLWAMQRPLHVSLKRTLDRFGITDRYPATASLTTLTYHTDAPDEIPEIAYQRPYGDRLSPKTLS
jgi:broad specificity phosphatase PhoE